MLRDRTEVFLLAIMHRECDSMAVVAILKSYDRASICSCFSWKDCIMIVFRGRISRDLGCG